MLETYYIYIYRHCSAPSRQTSADINNGFRAISSVADERRDLLPRVLPQHTHSLISISYRRLISRIHYGDSSCPPDLVFLGNERESWIKRGMNVKCFFSPHFFRFPRRTTAPSLLPSHTRSRARVRNARETGERVSRRMRTTGAVEERTFICLGNVAMTVWTYTNPFVGHRKSFHILFRVLWSDKGLIYIYIKKKRKKREKKMS